MSCDYCSVFARHPCTSRSEASKCGNNDDPGMYLDFNAREVALWIRAHSDDPELIKAADLIEEKM